MDIPTLPLLLYYLKNDVFQGSDLIRHRLVQIHFHGSVRLLLVAGTTFYIFKLDYVLCVGDTTWVKASLPGSVRLFFY